MMRDERGAERTLLYTVYYIYFFCGLTQCFEGVFLPEFKQEFHLSYQQQMYTMFAKNIPSLLALVIGLFVARVGYKSCITLAMCFYGSGTLLLVPGLDTSRYGLVLLGFFLIGTGFSLQIVSGNPLLCALGLPQRSASRLNLGNALGAVAQIAAPATLSLIIPASVVLVQQKVPYMKVLFVILASVLFATAIGTALIGNVEVQSRLGASESTLAGTGGRGFLVNPRLMFGFLAIFLVLGVESGLFALYRNYLEDPAIAGLSANASERLFTLYFALFALGRLAGSWVQRKICPAIHLLISLAGAGVCLLVVLFASNSLAVAGVTVIGFFVSIFYPTLYAMAIEGLGERTGQASGLLTTAFLGCAIIPVLQGRIADAFSLRYAYALGIGAYVFAAAYAVSVARSERSKMTASAPVSG